MTDSSDRGLLIATRPLSDEDIQRWAIVVGISAYQSQRLTLKYGDRDAEAFAALLQTPQGGNFAPDKVLKLVNQEATTAAITRALRSFLKKPAREDVVIIYFACHGTPDPDRPANLYLLTHDTDPDDIAGTALPMREIDLALRENLLAERVVVLADTCHSAGLGGGIGRRSATDDAGAFNTYLQEVSKTRGGVALLTSAETSETAQEGAQWGGGHGVFTHYLLQGLGGEADGFGNRARDGIVTVGELFDYVRANVTRDTNNLQHPALGTAPFDRSLPLAVTGGQTAREQYELGMALAGLGIALNDPARHMGATTQFRDAIRLTQRTQTPFIEAEIALGKSLYLSGRSGDAVRVLTDTTKRYTTVTADVYFWLGIALAKERDYPNAIRILNQYLGVAPETDEQRQWVGAYLKWLDENREPRNYGLFIGINQYQMTTIGALRGCVNDVTAVRTLLIERYGFAEEDTIFLADEAASRDAVRTAFQRLAQLATAGDRVIVHFSGHSFGQGQATPEGEPPSPAYLILNDTQDDGSNSISAQELHDLMKAIPADRKFLILDTHPHADLIQLSGKEGNYALLVASDSAETAYEYRFVFRGQFAVMGLLSGVLAQLLEESNPGTLTFGKLIDGVLTRINDLRFRQTSLFKGDRDETIFTPDDFTLRYFEFSLRRRYFDLPLGTLQMRYRDLHQRLPVPFPQAHLSFGLAFIEKEEYALAIEALQRWVAERQAPLWLYDVALAYAYFRAGDEAEAGVLLQSLYEREQTLTPALSLKLGQLFLTLGLADRALEAFRQSDSAVAEYLRGLVLGQRGEWEAGNQAMDTFLQRGDFATYSAESARWLLGQRARSVHVLLVGVEDYLVAPTIPYATQNVEQLRTLLTTHFKIPAEHITTLISENATRAAVLEAVADITARLMPDDRLILYFCGHMVLTLSNFQQQTQSDVYLFYDSNPNTLKNTLTAHEFIAALPPHRGTITLIMEQAGSELHAEVEQRENLLLLAGDSRPATSLEITARVDAQTGKAVGEFVYQLGSLLPTLRAENVTGETVIAGLIQSRTSLSPFFTGTPTLPLFTLLPERAPMERYALEYERIQSELRAQQIFDRFYSRLFQQEIYLAIERLESFINQRAQVDDRYSEGRLHLGVAYSAVANYGQARYWLEQARSDYGDPITLQQETERNRYTPIYRNEVIYQLGRVLLEGMGDYDGAVSMMRDVTRNDPDNAQAWYYLGIAIRQQIEQQATNEAATALQTYLELGAPLGQEEEVRRYLTG